MICWEDTFKISGVKTIDECFVRKTILVVACDVCGKKKQIKFRSEIRKNLENNDHKTKCNKCVSNDEEYIDNLRKKSTDNWKDNQYRSNNLSVVRSEKHRNKISKIVSSQNRSLTISQKQQASERAKKQWKDDVFRELITKSSISLWQNADLKKQMLESRRTIAYRRNQRQKALEKWKDPEYKRKQADGLAAFYRTPEWLAEIRRNQPKVSYLQERLYEILDDLGVCYYREYNDKQDDEQCKIGPYSIDCVVPCGNKRLLIDCHGEYWHTLAQKQSRDVAKESYIHNNLKDCEYKVLWEIEFLQNSAKNVIQIWLGMEVNDETIDFSFGDLEFTEIDRDVTSKFLSKYHYLHSIGRYGQCFGVLLNGKLIASSVFTPPIRQNHPKYVRELSRFCIHPSYHKKNLASWFLSRCIKKLDHKYTEILTFADLTFDHSGTIYLASNFVLDGKVRPDYWYVSADGWVMHKKTLYNQAVKMKMKESVYASAHGFRKTFGKGKLRFRYKRS